MFSMKKFTMKVYFYEKPLWLDDILWDILDISDNKIAPISFRSIGAYTINSQIEVEEYNILNEKAIDYSSNTQIKFFLF